MNSRKKIVILLIICLVVLVSSVIADKFMSRTYFKEIKYDKLIEKIENDDTFIFLISQTTCSHCLVYKPKLEQVANKHKIDIYYIDVDLLTKDQVSKLTSYVNYNSTPITVFLKNGEETTAASRINGDASIEKIENKLKSNGFLD